MSRDANELTKKERKTAAPVVLDPGVDESATQSECCSASMARYKASEDEDK